MRLLLYLYYLNIYVICCIFFSAYIITFSLVCVTIYAYVCITYLYWCTFLIKILIHNLHFSLSIYIYISMILFLFLLMLQRWCRTAWVTSRTRTPWPPRPCVCTPHMWTPKSCRLCCRRPSSTHSTAAVQYSTTSLVIPITGFLQ